MLPQHCLRQLSAAFTAANNHFHLVFFSFGRCAKWILLPTSISFSFHFLRAAQPCLVNLILAFHKIPRQASTPAFLALSFISFVPVYFTFLLPRLYLFSLFLYSSLCFLFSSTTFLPFFLLCFFFASRRRRRRRRSTFFLLLILIFFTSYAGRFLFLVYYFPRDIGRLLCSFFNAGRPCLTWFSFAPFYKTLISISFRVSCLPALFLYLPSFSDVFATTF